MVRFLIFFVAVFTLLLISAPLMTSHDINDTYRYEVYARINMRHSGALAGSLLPSKLVLVINGSTEFSIVGLSKRSVSLRLRPNLNVSGDAEPSSFRQYLQRFFNFFNASMNRIYEVNVPLDVLGYLPYGGLENLTYLGISISTLPIPLNVTTAITTAEFTIWRGVPALHLRFTGNMNTTQYMNVSAYVECESYLDPTTFLILYLEGKATYNYSHIDITANYVIEVKSELINIDVIKHINSRAYRVRFEEGESRIYVASENLSILGLSTAGNELIMNIDGKGISGITIFTTQDVVIKEILADNTPTKYRTLKYDNGNIIRIPLTLSSHEVRVSYEKTIKSVEEMPVVQAETNTLTMVLVVIVVPLVALVVLLAYLLKRKKSY
ncbi:MAG: hypothetical protein QN229_05920 [Desulfurococcaceae archaeon TW002]